MPALYEEDDLAMRLCEAIDDVIAPIVATLDNLASYFDAQECPDDFVEWLGGWVGMALDENWPVERQRALIATAGELYRWRGTVRGIRDLVAIYTGLEPEVTDSGGVAWSVTPGAVLPGDDRFTLTIKLTPPKKQKIDAARIESLVAAAKPAHVTHTVEVVTR
jgi:phage tail-like protein